MEYGFNDYDRFYPIVVKVKKGKYKGQILHGYIDCDKDEDTFCFEPTDDAESIPIGEDNWVEVEYKDGEWVEIDWDQKIYLTPKGCFLSALFELNLVDDLETANNCFNVFESRMKKAGYISDEEGKFHYKEGSETPEDMFIRTMNAFYPGTNTDQKETAYDLFAEMLKIHGNTKEDEDDNK